MKINVAKIKKWFLITLALFGVIGGVVFAVAYNANFSKGYRAGKIMKFSKRGVFLKTYEGQLDKGGIHTSKDGDMSSTWDFSVSSSETEIIKILEEVAKTGERVLVDYEEKYYKFAWRGDTKYIITGVTKEKPKEQTTKQDNLEEVMDKGKGENSAEMNEEQLEKKIRKELKSRQELKDELKQELKDELKEELKKEILEELKAKQSSNSQTQE
jgi:hypothetical protein